MNLKKFGKVFTSKFVVTGPSSFKKRIYRAAVSQRVRNTDIFHFVCTFVCLLIDLFIWLVFIYLIICLFSHFYYIYLYM